MAKLAQTSVKYSVRASFTAEGVVEKPDVIGALFGQTEGLLGPDLDLRELQRTGRVGRIEVTVQIKSGKTTGEITIPSSLDSTETALIAASLETIDRIGPCNTKIQIAAIEDLRSTKRQFMVERAKELLTGLVHALPETPEITEELMQSVRAAEVEDWQGLPAGPDVADADEVILVEGRADVVNLLKHGVKNVLGFGGTKVPENILSLSKEKEVTTFLDGDRGGDLILKALVDVGVEIDFVAKAPEGKEVEELTKKEIFKALRDKIPFGQTTEVKVSETKERTYAHKRQEGTQREYGHAAPSYKKKIITDDMKSFLKAQIDELVGTHAAAIFDKNMKFAGRVPVKELQNSIRQVEHPYAIVIDGIINKDLVKLAESVGVQNLVGKDAEASSAIVTILTLKDLQ